MSKIRRIMQYIFAIGILIGLLAGAGAFVGYVVALAIGGQFAAEICAFIYGKFFPIVIRVCSISVGIGLISMYLGRVKALSISNEESEQK